MLKRKLLIIYAIKQLFEPSLVSEIFTASNIATTFSIKRNTASHYLNQLNEEGILVKINTRPVYFFHKEAFQQQNYLLKRTVYQSFQEMIDEQPVLIAKVIFSVGHWLSR